MIIKLDIDKNQIESVKTSLELLDNIEILEVKENFNNGNFIITLICDNKFEALIILDIYFG